MSVLPPPQSRNITETSPSNSQQMYIAALAVLAFVGLVVYRRRNA